MEIGSLKECLHGKNLCLCSLSLQIHKSITNTDNKLILTDPLRTPLTWRIRLQIAIDIAAALVGDFVNKENNINSWLISSSFLLNKT